MIEPKDTQWDTRFVDYGQSVTVSIRAMNRSHGVIMRGIAGASAADLIETGQIAREVLLKKWWRYIGAA